MFGSHSILDMPCVAYRARYVFPVETPPLEGGSVVVQGCHIVAVGHDPPADEVRDLGNVALLPGLINAHTHLEFSDVRAPLGGAGMPLPAWIREVIQYRRTAARSSDAVVQGMAECVASGTAAIGEISQPGTSIPSNEDGPLHVLPFLELLALSAERVEPKLAEARAHLDGASIRRGLSPHAPYTVHLDLFQKGIALAQQRRAPLAFHLAESREELQLLRSAEGPFRQLFEELGFWVEGAIPRGARPLDYLKLLAEAPSALVVHGNYLDAEEIDFVAAHPRLTIVYCPRTHAYFHHAEHPWRQMLVRGINVAIGTDSRASNPDLSVLNELRFLAEQAGTLPPADLLRLGTICGARALGLDHVLGTLAPGKQARLCMIPLPDHTTPDPHDLWLRGTCPSLPLLLPCHVALS